MARVVAICARSLQDVLAKKHTVAGGKRSVLLAALFAALLLLGALAKNEDGQGKSTLRAINIPTGRHKCPRLVERGRGEETLDNLKIQTKLV